MRFYVRIPHAPPTATNDIVFHRKSAPMFTTPDTRRPALHVSSRFTASWMLCIGNVLFTSGCIMDADPREDELAFTEGYDDGETAGSSDEGDTQPGTTEANIGDPPRPLGTVDSVVMEPDIANGVACTQSNDCHEGCMCSLGGCVPSGFGPPPPSNVCDLPPQRSCTSASDCQSGCACSGGVCQLNGFGPPNPYCHLPPPDSYEYDDTWQTWKAYVGVPQQHNLHSAGDNDWVAVYMADAGNVRFRTYGLTYSTDTKIEVYSYDGITKGALLGSNDDIGGAWWIADSKSSKVQLPVAANTAYLVRVINKSAASIYSNAHEWPSYSLEIAYY